MVRCILCGREFEDGDVCPICGFEIQRNLYNDVRDSGSRDPLRLDESTREAMDRRNRIMLSYIRSIDPATAPQEQVDSTITEALRQLSIPIYVPIGKELSLNESESELISAIGEKMDTLDTERRTVCGSPETYIRLANGEYSIGKAEMAMAHLDKAILKDPKSKDALYNKGRMLFYEKEYGESLKVLEKLLRLDPDRDDVKYFMELVHQMKT